MQLNAEDGGNRRFVLVQLPEPTEQPDFPTIADITKARLRAAGKAVAEKQAAQQADTLPGLASANATDTGFRVFKLDSSNLKAWDGRADQLEGDLLAAVEHRKPDRSALDMAFEVLLKFGLDLSAPAEVRTLGGQAVHVFAGGALVVCLAPQIPTATVQAIAALKAELQPAVMRVVLADAGFDTDAAKTNAVLTLRAAGIDDVKSL